jgi:putative CocE/NonD family hydrolase
MTDRIRVEFDLPAPLRDGTVLRANVFRPAAPGSYPVALARTPYGKDFMSASPVLDAVRLARAGYIVVIQDVRGRFASGGEWKALAHEQEDGYDSVEWAARLPDANGRIGMFGASYFGFTQWAAALAQPPSLKALVPFVTWADVRDGVFWRGGALELGTLANWQLSAIGFDVLLRRHASAPPAERARVIAALVQEIDRLRTEGYWSLPLAEFGPTRRLQLAPELDELVAQPYSREHARPYSVAAAYDRVQVPAYNVGGWYDLFLQGTLQNFAALRANGSTLAARQARLLVGPWSHVNYGSVIGQQDCGYAAQLAFMNLETDLTGLTQRWFDYWLKGVENGVTREPPVRLFIMGENVWRDEQEWPLARARYARFYLHSNGRANSRRGDGALSTEPPGDEPADHYRYDPADPVPTLGGAILMHPLYGPGAQDQAPVEERPDVLVYTTAPLDRDVEVTGPVEVKLWAASDAPDTDFVARLVDVFPDGTALNLTDGIIRARYRNGDEPELLEPGQVYEYTLDLWATANVFKAGHRIRLQVTSSCFPRWDRNPNTGAPFGLSAELRPAHQTVYHDAAHPSHVVLPIIPREG